MTPVCLGTMTFGQQVDEAGAHALMDHAVERGIKREKAEKIFSLMAQFSDYGFNRSHSVAYAYLAFQTAYLKAHYPEHFYAAVLSSEAQDAAKVFKYSKELRAQKIALLPPDVNESNSGFTPLSGAIRYGLTAIKGLGHSVVKAITEARESGPFRSFFDFAERVESSTLNKRVFESLVSAGAFDSLKDGRSTGDWRGALFSCIDSALARAQRVKRERLQGQSGLFGSMPEEIDFANEVPPTIKGWTINEMLAAENQTLVSENPLAPRPPHFPAKAKRVIFLYMSGGVSHVDSFDPKPKLISDHGKKTKEGYIKRPNWDFAPHGKSGNEVSELFPHVAECVDDLCVIRSMRGDHGNHFEATLGIHTGSVTFARPSLGSWVSYGLGTVNQNTRVSIDAATTQCSQTTRPSLSRLNMPSRKASLRCCRAGESGPFRSIAPARKGLSARRSSPIQPCVRVVSCTSDRSCQRGRVSRPGRGRTAPPQGRAHRGGGRPRTRRATHRRRLGGIGPRGWGRGAATCGRLPGQDGEHRT